MANAKITLTNEANGGQRDAVSNEGGAFAFTSVQPGSYSLQIQQTGFKTSVRDLLCATSRGSFFNRYIRGHFPYGKLPPEN